MRPGVNHSAAMNRGDDRLSRVAMAEMDDAVVVADDLHMAEVVSMAKRQQFAHRTRLQSLHIPLAHPGKAPGRQGQDERDHLADQQPGKKRTDGRRQELSRARRSMTNEHVAPGSIRAQERVGPILTAHGSTSGLRASRSSPRLPWLIGTSPSCFVKPLRSRSRRRTPFPR